MAKKNLRDLLGAELNKSAELPTLHAAESNEATLPLEQITDRFGGNTRLLNPKHVESLAESIAVLGLIEPLVVDLAGRLLAGGHRKAAIALLKDTNPDAFTEQFPSSQIPVRVMPFYAQQEPDLALQIEVAENEQRRDYTPDEVRAIADRLREAGFVDLKGRPKKGQKALMPALSAVIGKSIRTVQSYLADSEAPILEDGNESTKRFVLLQQGLSKLQKWQKSYAPEDTEAEAQAKDIAQAIKLIEKVLKAQG
jgi:ParB family transcriptional regulator, chromosome partitioning protein